MADATGADVAVVIVTYRSAQLTIDCLRSVCVERERPGARIRCVVVDNASGDSPLIAQAVSAEGWSDWVSVIVAERNGGFAYGNNLGLRAVYAAGRPDYVHLLNPDTVLRPGAVSALVDFLAAHPKAGIAGGIFENADQSEWAIAFRFPSIVGELIHGLQWGVVSRLLAHWQVPMHLDHSVHPVDWVSGASMMVKRELIDRIGGLDESFFLYFEETEFCFRAKAAGYEVWYVPESRVVHIAGQSTKVTERNKAPRRLPGYWFVSRRHYFTLTRGAAYSILADLTALVAGQLGAVKRLAQSRPQTEAPHFLRDVLAHSLLWRRNRREAPRGGVPRF
jgi:N-acetylglucosaminyl-diphospho-decaprenol L-rhamnosyltransferase